MVPDGGVKRFLYCLQRSGPLVNMRCGRMVIGGQDKMKVTLFISEPEYIFLRSEP